MQIEYKPKSADRHRGLAYGKNNNYAPGQPLLVIVHGIKERGNETTDLYKPATHAMWGYLRDLADKYKFNIVWTQSNEDNTTDEIDYALEMGDVDLKADVNKIGILGVSWGGRRIKIWVMRGGLKGKYKPKTLTPIARGNHVGDDWTPIIESNVATWLHHGQADAVVNEDVSSITFKEGRKLNANAPIFYTEYFDDQNTATDEHNITRYMTDLKPRASLINTAYTVPIKSWYQWFNENNERNIPVAPDQPAPAIEAPPVTTPTTPGGAEEKPIEEPEIKPIPEPMKVGIARAVVNSNVIRFDGQTVRVPNNTLEIFYKDGTNQPFKAPPGLRCSGVNVEWTPEGNKYIMDIRDVNNYQQPSIIIGPYKN